MTIFNRKIVVAGFIVAFGSLVSGQAFAECETPGAPIIPDGNVASMDELVSAQQAMKLYQSSLGEYRICLQDLQEAVDPEAETAAAEGAALLEQYNTSVDAETAIAEKFNTAVKAFKARQPAAE